MTNALDAGEAKNLVLQLKQGSEHAFNSLYKLYAKLLYRKVRSIIKDDAKTEEIIQDLFLKIWQKRDSLNPDLSFKSYLYTIAHNLIYDYLRKVACDKRLSANLILNAVNYAMDTENVINARETENVLKAALNQLSPQQRHVFTLCKLEGKSYEEASQILGISIATVNSHIVKSNRYVRDYMHKNLELSLLLILILNQS
jgi:RNA polymerase sigma-70 factor (family 1)